VNARRALGALVCAASVCAGCSGGGDDDGRPAPSVTFATVPGASSTSSAITSPSGTSPSGTVAPGGSTPSSTAPAQPGPPAAGTPVVSFAPVAELDQPVDVAWRAGDPTMFVVERAGRIVPVRDGRAGGAVLDITGSTHGEGERGLLGLAFSPDGATAYIDHTNAQDDTVVASYRVGPDGVFDAASRTELLTIDQPYPNHNGGNVMIGPDHMLYIGMGDGGSGGDPERRALNVGELLGKILRIDPTPSGDSPYTVPPDNPFAGVEGARPEIWAVGVRNPWRMSFDPATGDLWFGDVGQDAIEEVDVAWAADGAGRGMNFGWSAFEGTHRYNEDQPADGTTPPIYEYPHGDAGCSISGGAVYRGSAVPALAGWYVFGDYCSGHVTALRVDARALTDVVMLGSLDSVAAVRAGPDGELYVVSIGGTISQITAG
jgi:glucose/arabinose dehydrogenase